MSTFIETLPKVELHMHIEGSMEPEMLFRLADKNKIKLPYSNLESVKKAYSFSDLSSFIKLYSQATEVICGAEDFYVITMDYLKRCHQENIRHAEIFCDIRTYVDRGYPADMVIEGIEQAFKKAFQEYGISGGMIPCFIRHLGPKIAASDWLLLEPFKDRILAVGLAAIEVGYPPGLFAEVFAQVRASGLPVVAHAGEEGPPDYIWSAINDLQVARIDHGIRALEDVELVTYLAEKQIPLTVCPCSNISLKIFSDMREHVIDKMLQEGLNVTINSDDPAHFGAGLSDNLSAIQTHCGITDKQLVQMMHNAIGASFSSPQRKAELHRIVDEINV